MKVFTTPYVQNTGCGFAPAPTSTRLRHERRPTPRNALHALKSGPRRTFTPQDEPVAGPSVLDTIASIFFLTDPTSRASPRQPFYRTAFDVDELALGSTFNRCDVCCCVADYVPHVVRRRAQPLARLSPTAFKSTQLVRSLGYCRKALVRYTPRGAPPYTPLRVLLALPSGLLRGRQPL